MEEPTTPASSKLGGPEASSSATANGSLSQPVVSATIIAAAGTPTEQKLSNAELKKRAKAEKQAKRQARKSESSTAPSSPAAQSPRASGQQPRSQQSPSRSTASSPNTSSTSLPPSTPPRQQAVISTGAGAGAGAGAAPAPASTSADATPDKEVAMFKHLYAGPRRTTIAGASKDVHPAVLALGLQMNRYEVCGSTARCIAMLQVFKRVINDYTTPPDTALARHLIPHCLSPQIDYLKSCRPISVSMGNAIRFLKDAIVKIEPQVPEGEAKEDLVSSIDGFIRERIVAADTLIEKTASSKISKGDVILTYANSSIVRRTILAAHKAGVGFRVIIVDAKPLYEGKNLAQDLKAAGIRVKYCLMTSLSHVVPEATKVFLGAHAMYSNGRLCSRVGTALVALLAHNRNTPVIVCCESFKFSDRVATESIVDNEVAPIEELLRLEQKTTTTTEEAKEALKPWQEVNGLQVLNIMYDFTPADYIDMVVTEFGSLPPSSVPAVLRMLETVKPGAAI